MFIDVHSHLLPYIDDGSKSKEMTINMLEMAEAEGIRSIIATPHYIYGYNKYNKNELHKVFFTTQELIQARKINIKLYLGNEIGLDIDTLKALKNKEALTLANSRYVLLELPNTWNDAVMEQLLYEVQLCDYRIVLAHIERYAYFKNHLELLRELIERGYITQINASSIISQDRKIRTYTHKLIKNGWVHLVSTDAHSDRRRRPRMQEAFEMTKRLIGEKAYDLFVENGQKIIDQDIIQVEDPILCKKKFWFLKRRLINGA